MRWPGLRRWSLWAASVFALVLLAAGWVLNERYREGLVDQAATELGLLLSLRQTAVEDYFDTVRAEITFWSLNEELIQAQADLADAYTEQSGDRLRQLYIDENPFGLGARSQLADAGDGSAYSASHARLHGIARSFVVERGYYDFFLIDRSGNVIFTVEKEDDFATSLADGPWADTGLADVYRRALATGATGRAVFSDFDRYEPSAGAPALFVGMALPSADGFGSPGVLALQVPTERLQYIMQFTAGMGETGETYLVGEDYLMRSDSRFSEASTTLETEVRTDTVELALAGEAGVQFTDDYRGVEVLSAYTRINVDGFFWAVMAEKDRSEVLAGANRNLLSLAIGELVVFLLAGLTFAFVGSESFAFGGRRMPAASQDSLDVLEP